MDSDDEFGTLISNVRNLDVNDVNESENEGDSEWKHIQFPLRSIPTFPKFEIPSESKSCFGCFQTFFSNSLFDLFVSQTNLYAFQQKSVKWKALTKDEFKCFIGCKILMSIHILPEIEMYWSTDQFINGNQTIQSAFSLNRFLSIDRYLHCVNNLDFKDINQRDIQFDCLYKVRTILDVVNQNCKRNFVRVQFLTIDETMVPYKGRNRMKIYMKNKPCKWGFKRWTLACSKTGYVIQFNYCKGKFETSSTLDVVCNLTNHLNQNGEACLPYFVHCDRYFTSIPLVTSLYNNGIYFTGTVMSNRSGIPKEFQKRSKKLKKNENIWLMNPKGMLLHSFHDTTRVMFLTDRHLPNMITRKRKHSEIEQQVPEVLVDYNKYARGVDLHDQHLSYYPTSRKSRKWWKYIFWNTFDVCILNGLLMRNQQMSIDSKKQTQLEFRIQLAKELIGSYTSRKQRKYTKQQMSDRYVGRHFPERSNKRRLCLQCKKQTIYICDVCKGHLCPFPCFKQYHSNL